LLLSQTSRNLHFSSYKVNLPFLTSLSWNVLTFFLSITFSIKTRRQKCLWFLPVVAIMIRHGMRKAILNYLFTADVFRYHHRRCCFFITKSNTNKLLFCLRLGLHICSHIHMYLFIIFTFGDYLTFILTNMYLKRTQIYCICLGFVLYLNNNFVMD